uniref:N-acetyltransferase n=1 Tax=Staphylococcus epidermidis TaxID=1282 RepID=UPI001642F6ED
DKNETEIDDSGVCDEVGGEGVGKKLVNGVVEDGGEKNVKIIGCCGLGKKVLEKDDDGEDVYVG